MDRETVAVYEARAAEWRDRRPPRFPELARELGADIAPGAIRIDVGCGSGGHLEHLGRPVVAFDAARAMLQLARDATSDAPRDVWCVQGDLEAMPFRFGSMGGSWARASYLHVPRSHLPAALMELHRALTVGAPAAFTMLHGTGEGTLPDDEFAGRMFAQWEPERLGEMFVGAGFEVDSLVHEGEWIHVRARRARTLPDFVGPGMRLLLCGLNPSIYAADAGVGFARPGNRFWPAALAAGLVSRDRDPLHALRQHGVGMTDLCKRATRSANELTEREYREGAKRVRRLVEWLRPRAICFLGLAGWRAAVDPKAQAGEQPDGFDGVPAYVMPNPSGVNAHASFDDITGHLVAAQRMAGA